MAENSYKRAIEEAREGIRSLGKELETLDAKILKTAELARKNLALPVDNTASGLDKKIKQQEKYLNKLKEEVTATEDILKKKKAASAEIKKLEDSEVLALEKARALRRKAYKEREAELRQQQQAEREVADEKKRQIQRIIDMNNSLRKQQEAQQSWQFKNMAKATKEEKKLAAEALKTKKAREAAISKQMTGRMIEYVNSIGKTNDGLIKMRLEYRQLEKETNKVAQAEDKVKAAREKAISKQMTGQMIEYVNSIGKANDQLVKMGDRYAKLEAADKKRQSAAIQAANQDARQRVNQAALAKNAEMYARANSRLVGSFKNLIAKRDIAKKQLQDEMAKEKQNIALIKQKQREYDKLADKVNRINDATARYGNKTMRGMLGNMQMLTRGVRDLAYAFGFIGGLYMFADLVKQGFQLAKTLDSLNFAMKTIITDSTELARTQVFLADITERFGASIVTTTERYTKFLAAAKQSGLSLKETEDIFRTMTKAAGALGLKTHELEGVYLALEQMLSKGKVTTEELRRQLGERLPGAFGIMAEAMGVSVSELDKMLRKGEVLSHEALPAFAKAVEKAYGIETLDRVENLNAAHQRFMNSWVALVGSITKSEGPVSNALIGLLDTVTAVVEGFQIMNDTMDNAFKRGKTLGGSEWSDYMEKEMDVWREINKKRLALMKEAGNFSEIAMLEKAEMERIGKQRLDYLEDQFRDYSTRLAELQREAAAEHDDNFMMGMLTLGGDTMSDWLRENEMNQMNEKATKFKEMIRLAREAAGMSREDILQVADQEDINNIVHVNKNLEHYQKRLIKLKKIKEQTAEVEMWPQAKQDALDAEILKTQQLIDNYTVLAQRAMGGGKGWWDFTTGFGEEPIDRGRTYADVLADIAYQKKLLDESLDHEAPDILDKIDELEQEAKAWERNNDAKKGSARILKDTLKWYEEEKSRLEDQRDRLAQSATERDKYNVKIAETEEAIRKLTRARKELDYHFVGEFGFDFSMEGTRGGIVGSNMQKLMDGWSSKQFDKNQRFEPEIELKPKVFLSDSSIDYWQTFEPINKEMVEKFDAAQKAMKEGEFEDLQKWNEKKLEETKKHNEAELQALKEHYESDGYGISEYEQSILDDKKEAFDESFNLLKENLSAEEEALKASYEMRKALIEEFNENKMDLVEAGIEAIGDRRVEDVENEIERNREKYAEILASEKFTEDQRALIEAQRDKRETALEKKKRRREKEAFLLKQGFAVAEIYMNLAQTIAAIETSAQLVVRNSLMAGMPVFMANAMGVAHVAANKPMAIANAAVATGMVLAQSIPQLYTGTDNAPEGWALVDELRPEVHTDKHGNVKSFGENGPNFRYLEAGDKIFKSHYNYFQDVKKKEKPEKVWELGSKQIEDAVWTMNLTSNGNQLEKADVNIPLINEVMKLRASNDKLGREMKKIASRPIHVNNEVRIKDDRPY